MNKIIAPLALLAWMASLASAADAPSTNISPWKTTLSAGVTLTDGNSKTLKNNANFLVEGEKDLMGSIRAGVEANYGKSTVEDKEGVDTDNAKAFANVKKTISARTFAYGDTSVLYDTIAKVNHRITIGPGAGIYLIKNDNTALSTELGPSYIWENKADISSKYVALRVAERLDQTLSATAKCWQSLEYLPKIDDYENNLLITELGVEAAVNSHIALRLVFQDKYDSKPGAGLKSNDLTFIGGLSLKL